MFGDEGKRGREEGYSLPSNPTSSEIPISPFWVGISLEYSGASLPYSLHLSAEPGPPPHLRKGWLAEKWIKGKHILW